MIFPNILELFMIFSQINFILVRLFFNPVSPTNNLCRQNVLIAAIWILLWWSSILLRGKMPGKFRCRFNGDMCLFYEVHKFFGTSPAMKRNQSTNVAQ